MYVLVANVCELTILGQWSNVHCVMHSSSNVVRPKQESVYTLRSVDQYAASVVVADNNPDLSFWCPKRQVHARHSFDDWYLWGWI